MPRSLVFIDNAFVNHAVNNRHSGVVSSYCYFFVALLDCFYDIFNMGSHFRAKPHLVKSRFLCLARALLS